MSVFETLSVVVIGTGIAYIFSIFMFYLLTFGWVWLRYLNTRHGPFSLLTWFVGVDNAI